MEKLFLVLDKDSSPEKILGKILSDFEEILDNHVGYIPNTTREEIFGRLAYPGVLGYEITLKIESTKEENYLLENPDTLGKELMKDAC